eukprot:TRINITY_DN34354_c0_g1_i1.p1 TRINITY_DN34354_c0_g1~~TRINITY_DN34354_c0_g1_i1.p1  ORF type:complete len:285 (+),score=47.01 TRINITY_DN34354_c0_g1_i1:40-894(+)
MFDGCVSDTSSDRQTATPSASTTQLEGISPQCLRASADLCEALSGLRMLNGSPSPTRAVYLDDPFKSPERERHTTPRRGTATLTKSYTERSELPSSYHHQSPKLLAPPQLKAAPPQSTNAVGKRSPLPPSPMMVTPERPKRAERGRRGSENRAQEASTEDTRGVSPTRPPWRPPGMSPPPKERSPAAPTPQLPIGQTTRSIKAATPTRNLGDNSELVSWCRKQFALLHQEVDVITAQQEHLSLHPESVALKKRRTILEAQEATLQTLVSNLVPNQTHLFDSVTT